MLARLRSKLTYANVMATIAVFLALGGGAYALKGKNSVNSGDIKPKNVKRSDLAPNSVNSKKVIDGSLLKGDFANGQLPRGPQGAPGEDATKLFAYIRDDGAAVTANVEYGSGVTAVSDPAGGGQYHVTFNRSLVDCVVQAANGFGNPRASGNAFPRSIPFVIVGGDADDQVAVDFFDVDMSATVDTSFLITAFC